jgi:hypothetical protein
MMIFFNGVLVSAIETIEEIFGKNTVDYALDHPVKRGKLGSQVLTAWVRRDFTADYDEKLRKFVEATKAKKLGKGFVAEYPGLLVKLLPV